MENIFRTVEEAVEYLNYLKSLSDGESGNSSDEEIDICQLPPDENERLTDEEDIGENRLEQVTPKDVCGQVALFINKNNTNDNDTSDDRLSSSQDKPFSSEDQASSSISSKKRKRAKASPKTPAPKVSTPKKPASKKPTKSPNWSQRIQFEDDIQTEATEKLADKYPHLINAEPIDMFFEYITKDYISHLAQMITIYAAQHGTNLSVEWTDIAQFLGLLLLSGYHSVPTEESYWSTAEDISVAIVPTVMSRNRFREIKNNFHVMDNYELDSTNKLAKIQPLYDELNKQFMKFGIFHKTLSIDESMVPYYGHHSCKMFIRGKPIRFGFKIWMMCSSNGYPYSMEIYAGKPNNCQGPIVPLGKRVVTTLLSVVSNPLQVEVYFDNFFTSYDLLNELREKNIKATGTAREGRIAKCPLMSTKEMSKKKRGFFDYKMDGSVYICRWNDNAVVTIASNHDTHLPLRSAKRYSAEKKRQIVIDQPNVLANYNRGMGGVDVLDRMLGSYRPKLRSKKWWWNLFSNALNMAVVTAWLLYKEINEITSPHFTHLDFRRQVAMALMRTLPRKDGPRTGPQTYIPLSRRKIDGHYIISASQGRCVHCGTNTKYQCKECQKRIHIDCFPKYHGL